MSLQTIVTEAFTKKYGEAPTLLVQAPGRVNLIGEHTDYNDGFVMPLAIERAVTIALRPRKDDRVQLQSLDFAAPIDFDLKTYEKGASSPAEYVKGVAWALQEAGYALQGFEGILKGDVPIGAGLSSSAALELATMRAFAALSDIAWSPSQMALLAQKAENQWVGVSSGIMDQMISASGIADYALLIDCRSLETENIPLPDGAAVVILDTSTRRELVTSAYNERRQQCEAAAQFFSVKALRDVTPERFEAQKIGLDALVMRRAKHVIYENERVLKAKAAMQGGDMTTLGNILDEGHSSLRDDFEVSSDALNAIVEAAQSHPACYGARMTGGGFAGCAVALVQADAVTDFVAHVSELYSTQTSLTPALYVTRPTQGAQVLVDTR